MVDVYVYVYVDVDVVVVVVVHHSHVYVMSMLMSMYDVASRYVVDVIIRSVMTRGSMDVSTLVMQLT